jgi:hypothetical protein
MKQAGSLRRHRLLSPWLAASLLLMTVGGGLFGLFRSTFQGATTLPGAEPSYTQTIGLPQSPWLVGRCTQFASTQNAQCVEWTWSVNSRSYSWIGLGLFFLGVGACFASEAQRRGSRELVTK